MSGIASAYLLGLAIRRDAPLQVYAHARQVLLTERNIVATSFSVGPTVRIISVHRFAASSLSAGPPTPFRVGPTVRIISVHRFAASSLSAGPPTPFRVGPTVRILS